MNWLQTTSSTGGECPLCGGRGMSTPSQPCAKCGGSGRIGAQEEPVLSPEARKEKLKRSILERREKMKRDFNP